jgi:cytochrome b involved in lipid metabolism
LLLLLSPIDEFVTHDVVVIHSTARSLIAGLSLEMPRMVSHMWRHYVVTRFLIECPLILGGPKVYNVTNYLESHPGGPEIIMEFAGKNGDDMFEDIGHSKEARAKMNEFLIGSLKEDGSSAKATKAPSAAKQSQSLDTNRSGLNPLAVLAVLLALVAGLYFSSQK